MIFDEAYSKIFHQRLGSTHYPVEGIKETSTEKFTRIRFEILPVLTLVQKTLSLL